MYGPIQGLCRPVVFYVVACTLMFVSALCGRRYITQLPSHGAATSSGLVSWLSTWDGKAYADIARNGYEYTPGKKSDIVFFPAYPVAARLLLLFLPVSAEAACLLVSHVCLLLSFVLLDRYLAKRVDARARTLGLALFAVLPPNVFMHAAYSESMFCFLVVVTLIAMERQWPIMAIAALVGVATATRAAGVALAIGFAVYMFVERRRDGSGSCLMSVPRWRRGVAVIVLLTISTWGIIAFQAYQYWRFGDPIAFVRAESRFRSRIPVQGVVHSIIDAATLEPVRATYTRRSACYWGRTPPYEDALCNIVFGNPLFFVCGVVVLAVGATARWLRVYEIVIGLLLIVIPYVIQSPRQCMVSEARFMSVCIPFYVVAGRMLSTVPSVVASCIMAASAVFFSTYAAYFASWYPVW